MINLLPPKELQQLKEEKNLKIILHLGIFLFLFLISFYLVLLVIQIQFEGVLKSKETFFEKEKAMLDLDLEKEIKDYNSLLKKIDAFEEQKIYFLPILEKISKDVPEKISLNNVSLELNPKKGKEISIFLSGISPDRETFLNFIKVLKENYSDVSFSQESLLKQTNIEFSMNFKIK